MVESKVSIIKTYGGNEKNTGEAEVKIALLSKRILEISDHLKSNKKDFSTQAGLLKLVGQRKSLLKYLQKNDINRYRALIEKLGLRK